MTTHAMRAQDAFGHALVSQSRAPEIPEASDIYGWFVGSWDLDVKHYWAIDVSAEHITGEIQAGRVLEGRAVQDVWIMPRRDHRTGALDKRRNMYGTTLRVWDSVIQAWRITWSNPAGDHYEEQIGRRSEGEIVQLGTRVDGTPTRWRFIEITADSFHWLGEALEHDGRTWRLEGEFYGTRSR